MKLQSLVLASVTALTMTTAFAVPAGTWTVAAGAHMVDPKSDNGTLKVNDDLSLNVDVDDDIRPTISGEYFVANNVGIELLAAIPFHHDITLTNTETGDNIDAKTQHLPPTLSVQYHFDGYNMPMNVKPFVGVGVNYTTFFKERIYLGQGNDLNIKDSVGVAGHIGIDIPFTPRDAFRIDARYMDIKPDVELNGKNIGEVDISPWVYGVAFVKTF